MKKIKYLLLALTLVFTFGIANVNAETGKTPGTITTKEDLLYYIYYYGGKATITGNTIKLTENLELNQGLTFNNSENITLDLNGNGIYLKNDKIMILASSKSIKITDSSNSTNKGYIRSQSSYAIYNNGISGKLSLENIKLITNSTDPTLYT